MNVKGTHFCTYHERSNFGIQKSGYFSRKFANILRIPTEFYHYYQQKSGGAQGGVSPPACQPYPDSKTTHNCNSGITRTENSTNNCRYKTTATLSVHCWSRRFIRHVTKNDHENVTFYVTILAYHEYY